MSDYKEIIELHKKNLDLNRKIIASLICRLEIVIKNNTFNSENSDEWKYLWGEKESVVSVITKLTGLLVKVIPMERMLFDYEKAENMNKSSGRIINSDDKEIIKRYIKKLSKTEN